MYINCPECKGFKRMPDFVKDENKFEKIKCYNCNAWLMYKYNGDILITKKEHDIIGKKKKMLKLKKNNTNDDGYLVTPAYEDWCLASMLFNSEYLLAVTQCKPKPDEKRFEEILKEIKDLRKEENGTNN